MSLQNLAQHLAAHGRGNDKMLMHVTPREVVGLQGLAMAAGGSLTVNPHTGLPEAGFFDAIGDFLPTILGTAAGFMTGNPYIGAAVAGGTETAKSGNLLSGIMAGLSAFGMQGLGQTLANAAPGAAPAALGGAGSASALPTAAEMGASATAAQAAGQAPMAAMVGTPGGLSPQTAALNAMKATDPTGFAGTIANMPKINAGAFGGSTGAVTGATTPTLGTMSAKAPLTMSNIMSGIKNIAGPGGLNAFKTAGGTAGAPLTGREMLSRAAAPLYGLSLTGTSTTPEIEEEGGSAKHTPLSEIRKRYGYAMGGDVDTSRQQFSFDMRNKPMGERNDIDGGYAKGGYLDGPGDGMSDSIPATIEDKQPARLADGEFVIPADVVSHLGNGSTKAGAKRLYEMMSRVRKARTGNHKQGKQINPDKFVPA